MPSASVCMRPFLTHTLLLLSAVCSSHCVAGLVFHERRDVAPPGFELVGPAPDGELLSLRLALKHRDYDALEKVVYEVSDPAGEGYGRYLSKDDIDKLVAPDETTSSAVASWLTTHGIHSSSLSTSGDMISIEVPVSQANNLFSASFSHYEHDELSATITRTLSYAVPKGLEGHVKMVHPTVSFPILSSELRSSVHNAPSLVLNSVPRSYLLKRHGPSHNERDAAPHLQTPDDNDHSFVSRDEPIPESCLTGPATISCRFDLYGLSREPGSRVSNVWLTGATTADAFFVRLAHLVPHRTGRFIKQYMQTNRPDVPTSVSDFDLVTIDGGLNNQLPLGAGFATGYMELLQSTAANISTTFFSIGTDKSSDIWDWFMDEAEYLLAMETPPQVVLILSFTRGERSISSEVAQSLCRSYAQLAARGVSIISGVGALGVAGSLPQDCSEFEVSFPASCPFVTSVGGTHVGGDVSVETAEPYTNGGFSNLFARPAYQEKVAGEYISGLGGKYDGLYNKTGRGIPDLALLDSAQLVLSFGPNITFSTPDHAASVFAGVVAVLNEKRILAGKQTLGFLNPWIYANQGAFGDITAGNNPGCGTEGFNATVGWDPVTGVGSPWYAALERAAGV